MFLEVPIMKQVQINTQFDEICTTKGIHFIFFYFFFSNEGIPYGAMVAMATCVILITFFHKILYVSWIVYNIRTVWHKCQSWPNISNLHVFLFFNFNSIPCV